MSPSVQPNPSWATTAPSESLVCVARDQDDDRYIFVPLAELANVHMAVDCGGRRQILARPNLAAYMWPSLIPTGAAFGYDGQHAHKRPCRIKVLVRVDHTATDVVAELEALVPAAKLQRRPPKLARIAARRAA